ncbi:TonB-dependent receptor [Salinisphaera sp.]|uniref:TonB-dependent receptor family protein n=1 Tax=Salinisphaera sp. TaxID=1914330 RepID=UPI002D779932|nr:TonB-dependent receptor [Salinisphaera sp.]HET7313619.1 TonB-dependent receptor [Salinisphaera sp.]
MKTRPLVIGGLLIAAGPLYAQDPDAPIAAPAPAASSAADAPVSVLAPIQVNAFRLGQDLLSIPAAVGVIRHDAIARGQRKIQLDSALNRVPGVYTNNSSNFAQNLRVSIRGFGARSAFGVRGVRVRVDGIPATLVDGQAQTDSIDPGAIERIVVLRGPFSALYGNATGGVINITTLKPSDGPLDAAEVTGGSNGYHRESVSSAHKYDQWGYAATLTRLNQKGYRQHSKVVKNQFTGKIQRDIGADGRLMLTTRLLHAPNTQDPGGVTRATAAADRHAARDANLDYDARQTVGQETFGGVFTDSLSEHQDYKLHAFYSHRNFIQYLPFGTTSGGGVVTYRRNFFGGGGQSTRYDTLFGHDNRLVLGIDVQTQQDDRQRYNNDFGSKGRRRFNQDETATNVGVFAQNEFAITPNLKATAGARYDWLDFDIDDHFESDGDQSGSRDYRRASFNAGINYAWAHRQHVYANIANAFESPTFTEFANPSGSGGFNPDLDPQKAINYEIGAKGEFGHRGRYQIDAFWIEVRDAITAYAEQGDRTFYQNSGRSRRRGIESKLSFELGHHLSATLAYTAASYEYRDFVDENGNNYAGNRLPGIPEQTAFGELAWQRADIGYAAVDVHWTGSIYADDANTARVAPHTVVNARVGKTVPAGAHRLTAYAGVDNLLDQEYFDNIRINSYGGRYFEPAPGRTIYIGLKYRL